MQTNSEDVVMACIVMAYTVMVMCADHADKLCRHGYRYAYLGMRARMGGGMCADTLTDLCAGTCGDIRLNECGHMGADLCVRMHVDMNDERSCR